MKCTFRSVMIGDSAVGKTSIVNRFLRNSFDQSEPSTIGALYESHNETRNGKPIELQIWDTAGQEQYRSLGPIYFRSSAGAILVFDITNQKSFDNLEEWLNFYRNAGCENTVVMIVGNKNDLTDQRVVTAEQGQAWATAHGCTYMETSALLGMGIKSLFKTFIDQLLAQFEEEHEKRQSKMPKSATGLPPPAKEQKSGCC